MQVFWIAFDELTTERQIGMGLGPIPVSKIKQYAAEELELSGDELDQFFSIIRRIDDEYLTLSNSPNKETPAGAVAADDVKGVKRLFDSTIARQKNNPRKKPAHKKP